MFYYSDTYTLFKTKCMCAVWIESPETIPTILFKNKRKERVW